MANRQLLAQKTRELSYLTSKLYLQLSTMFAKVVNYIGGEYIEGPVDFTNINVRGNEIFDGLTTFLTSINKDAAFADYIDAGGYPLTIPQTYSYLNSVDTEALLGFIADIQSSNFSGSGKVILASNVHAKHKTYQEILASVKHDLTNALITDQRINRALLPYIEMFALEGSLTADEFVAPLLGFAALLKKAISNTDDYNWIASENIDLINGLDAELLEREINESIKPLAQSILDI